MATAFCVRCGSPGEGTFCAECGQARDAALAPAEHGARAEQAALRANLVARAREKHGVPALMSFFIPGLGQLVKGEVFKGVAIFVGMFFSFLSMYVMIGFITTPSLWLWQTYDAYTAPDSATSDELKRLSSS